MQAPKTDIKQKDRDILIQALRAGVVPRTGIRHVQVGRAKEVTEVNRILDAAAGGSTFFKIALGSYGSGKTFFISLARSIAQEKKMATMTADLSPERRLNAANGQARALLTDLVRSLSTRTKPDGNALEAILQRFLNETQKEAGAQGVDIDALIAEKLEPIIDLSGGYDAVTVIRCYAEADKAGDEIKKDAALRWFRAEFSTKTEARELLPVRNVPTDQSFWDHIKIIGAVVRAAGYAGLFVALDEMVNLYKISHYVSRVANYEQILFMLNDLLQGQVSHIGLMLGGTPEFLMDTRRGLYSYEALRSRLAENTFAGTGLTDLAGPVLRLQNLTPEEMWVLLQLLRGIYLSDASITVAMPDEALKAFMEHCRAKIGAAYFQTPRATIRAFLDLLEVLRQNPGVTWEQVLPKLEVREDKEPKADPLVDENPSPAAAPRAVHPAPTGTLADRSQGDLLSATGPKAAVTPANGNTQPATLLDDQDDDLQSFRL